MTDMSAEAAQDVRDARNKARVFESTKDQFQAAYAVLAARANKGASSTEDPGP